MDENDIPDASLEIFQWLYDGKSSSIDDQTNICDTRKFT